MTRRTVGDQVSSDRGTTVGFRSERGAVLFALMLATGLIAIDATILAPTAPVDDAVESRSVGEAEPASA